MYYRNAQSALVVYDLTKPTSLTKAKHWVAELQRQASPGIVIALVGNKLDLTNDSTTNSSGNGTSGDNEDDGASDGETGPLGGSEEEADGGDARKVSTKEAMDYAEEEGLLFFETSAKTGVNVSEVFTAIANAIPETSLKSARGPGGAAGGGGQTALGAGRGESDPSSRVNLTGPRGDGPKEGCAC